MYIDSGKDLKVEKITSPRPDKAGPNGNKRTQVPVKPTKLFVQPTKSMKSSANVKPEGGKY